MPPTSAVYAHFRDLPRLDHLVPELRNNALPYPPDDAAVHHVFPGGWIWVLRFNNGITSAGAAICKRPLTSSPTSGEWLSQPRELWQSILKRFPTLQESFRFAIPTTPFYFTSQLSFRREKVAGENWALLPSSAGFVDPLLSSGFALTLLGIIRLGRMFRDQLLDLSTYEQLTFSELYATADLVSALYAKMSEPEEFTLLSLLYFAAMSYSETAWRLGKTELASGFLLTNDERFSTARSRVCGEARGGGRISAKAVSETIEPYDVAGLTDWKRNNWHPVDFADVRKNAHKLGANMASVENLFKRLGLDFDQSECLGPEAPILP